MAKSRKPVTSKVRYWPGSLVQPTDSLNQFTAMALKGKSIRVIAPDPDLIKTYRSFPTDPRGKLALVLKMIYDQPTKPDGTPRPPTAQEKHDLATNMYAFVASCGFAPIGGPVTLTLTGKIDRDASGNPINLRTRINNEILRHWDNMIQHVLSREPVEIVPDRISTVLAWSEHTNRFAEQTWFPQDYHTAAARAFAKLLVDYGHLIKECPAPKLRGHIGQKCETVFVASRPNKLYCSSACQSRATTAGLRERDKRKRKPK